MVYRVWRSDGMAVRTRRKLATDEEVTSHRVAWRETAGVTIERLAKALGRTYPDTRRALYGRSGLPLSKGELRRIARVIRQLGGAI